MATNVPVVALSSYSRGFHFTINRWQSIAVHYLVLGSMPCPEVVAISYIRQAEVPTLFSAEGDTQVKQKNHEHRFLTWQISHLVSADTFDVSRDTGDVWTGRMKIT